MRKQRHTSPNLHRARDHFIRTIPYRFHHLSANNRRRPHTPVRSSDRPHLRSRLSLPHRRNSTPSKSSSTTATSPYPAIAQVSPRALHRTNEDCIKLLPGQILPQRRCLLAPTVSQRNIRRTRMLPARTPLRLPMPPHQLKALSSQNLRTDSYARLRSPSTLSSTLATSTCNDNEVNHGRTHLSTPHHQQPARPVSGATGFPSFIAFSLNFGPFITTPWRSLSSFHRRFVLHPPQTLSCTRPP